MTQVVLLSVPYCEPLPAVAPVLLAGCLESAGITAQAIDFNAEFLNHFTNNPHAFDFKHFLTLGNVVSSKFNRKFFKEVSKFSKKFLQTLVTKHQPEYIGISIFTSESLDFGLLLSYYIRQYCPGVKIIAGGKGLEVSDATGKKHYEHWINNGVVDTVVVGDAEFTVVEVIKNNLIGVVKCSKQTKEDLDRIPLPKWQDYDLTLYPHLMKEWDKNKKPIEPYFSITASKGCVRQCTFCDVASFWPEYLYRDPRKVAEEIIYNYNATGIKKFEFTDNLINGSISNFRTMNEILALKIPNTINYGGYAIFRGRAQMPEDDFALAASAGCRRWSIGVESGSEKVRYDMKKKFTNDDIDWSVNMLYKYNILQVWLLMVGYPTETEKDFQDTKALINRYSSVANSGLIHVQVTPPFMLLNNSPLIQNKELYVEYGLEKHQDRAHADRFWTSTKYIDNDYPTRSRRWKELINLIQSCGYTFGASMPVEKWQVELEHLDKIYNENHVKIFPIRSA